ncbi:hypothetical protein DBZ36_20125 [Alginatibacterium sediminis]|uniref:Uncharacterized protein n=1 Tax=Alginatibacterium sediminis TaxID=2164068 RepID=A0A420E5I7_9ALTE|nr:hypothetical protein DBZ36_20125 [Alginatibacterium sediminis]
MSQLLGLYIKCSIFELDTRDKDYSQRALGRLLANQIADDIPAELPRGNLGVEVSRPLLLDRDYSKRAQ